MVAWFAALLPGAVNSVPTSALVTPTVGTVTVAVSVGSPPMAVRSVPPWLVP